ncbi:MAG: C25 family peptidase propeptide domain-containing protein, partial [Candidatus Cloacimonadota bacterium]|nr:C25 family peptidase propeptide domain-containing protein [Candidatus Cloacimonadota bacterium]
MKHSFIMLLSILLFGSIFANTFEVLEETENSLIVKFTLPEYKIRQKGFSYEISCKADGNTSQPGFAQLPYYSQLIGLPINGDMQIEIIEKKVNQRNRIKIKPASEIIYHEDRLEYVETELAATALKTKLYPQNLLKKGEFAFIGDRYFGSFQIYPFQYDHQQSNLKITSEITLKINIIGKKEKSKNWRSNNNYIDKEATELCLNNTTSRSWRLQTEKTAKKVDYRDPSIVNAIQLLVDSEGIYKITYEYLTDSLATYWEKHPEYSLAFNWEDIDPRLLELSDENGPVPIHFVGESDGSFDPGDYFEFWGEMHHGENTYYDDYSSINTYELTLNNSYGCRMAVENGGIQVNDESQFKSPESFPQTLHFEEQNVKDHLGAQFSYNSKFYREDIWFWKKMYAPKLNLTTINLEYPHNSGIRKFYCKASLWGLTY